MGYVEGLLAENETIVVRTRQHPRVLAGSLLANGFLFLVLLALGVGFQSVPLLKDIEVGPLVLILFVFAIFPILALLRDFLEWSYEEYVITNRRVIQAQGVLSKHVIDSALDKVNDVVLSQSFLGRLFDYGDIEILTASESGVNLFHSIAHPLRFKMAMMNQRESRARGVDQRQPRGDPDAADLLKELEELHQEGVLNDQEYLQKKAQLLARM